LSRSVNLVHWKGYSEIMHQYNCLSINIIRSHRAIHQCLSHGQRCDSPCESSALRRKKHLKVTIISTIKKTVSQRVREPVVNSSLISQCIFLPIHMPPEVSNDLAVVSPQTLVPGSKWLFIVEMHSSRDLWIVYDTTQYLVQMCLHNSEFESDIVKFFLVPCYVCKHRKIRGCQCFIICVILLESIGGLSDEV